MVVLGLAPICFGWFSVFVACVESGAFAGVEPDRDLSAAMEYVHLITYIWMAKKPSQNPLPYKRKSRQREITHKV